MGKRPTDEEESVGGIAIVSIRDDISSRQISRCAKNAAEEDGQCGRSWRNANREEAKRKEAGEIHRFMKIIIETPDEGQEDEIIIRCARLDDKLIGLLKTLKTDTDSLTGYVDDKIAKLEPKEILYFESVDNKVFAYARKAVYEVRIRLYEIEQQYSHGDFMRISKSMIVNVAKIAYIRPLFNGRFEATLKNGEKVVISRQYVTLLKKKLDI